MNALEKETGSTSRPGVFVLIHKSAEWPAPEHAKFIPQNTEICLIVTPTLYTTSEDVSKVHYIARQCVFTVSEIIF